MFADEKILPEKSLCVPYADSDELSPADILRQAQELGAAAARTSEYLDTQKHLTPSGACDLPAPFMQAALPACGDSQTAAAGMTAAKDTTTSNNSTYSLCSNLSVCN